MLFQRLSHAPQYRQHQLPRPVYFNPRGVGHLRQVPTAGEGQEHLVNFSVRPVEPREIGVVNQCFLYAEVPQDSD